MVARLRRKKLESPPGDYRMGFPSGEGGHIGYIRNSGYQNNIKSI